MTTTMMCHTPPPMLLHSGGRVLRWLPSALPPLMPLLTDPHTDLRQAAATCLAVLGAQAAAILPSTAPPLPPVPAPPPHTAPALVPPALHTSASAATAAYAALSYAPPPPPPPPTAHAIHHGRRQPPPPAPPPPPVPGRLAPQQIPSDASPSSFSADPSAVFFNWCLNALSRKPSSGSGSIPPLPASVQSNVLFSLSECIKRTPESYMERHAARIMDMCTVSVLGEGRRHCTTILFPLSASCFISVL